MKIDSAQLSEAINICNKIVDSVEVNLECNGKNIVVSKASNFNKVSVKVRCDSDKCNFSIDNSLLLGILRGTKEIELKYTDKDKSLSFKGGNKKGVLSTLIYKQIEVIPSSLKDKLSFEDKVKSLLVDLLPTVAISATPFLPESESNLDIQISSGSKGIRLLCADRYHSAYCECKVNAPQFSLNIPTSYINYLSLFDKEFNMAKDDNCLYVYNNDLKICLPQVATSNLINIKSYNDFMKSNLSNPLASIEKFNLSDFTDAMDSVDTVKTATTDIYLLASKEGVKVKCESELGKIYSDVTNYKVKKSYEAILNQPNTYDILRLASKDCVFNMYENFISYNQVNEKTRTSYVFLSSVGHKETK